MASDIFTLDDTFLIGEYSEADFKMYKILNAYKENNDKGIRVAKEYFKSEKAFQKAIDRFEKAHINADEFLDDLNDILPSYGNVVKKEKGYINRSIYRDTEAMRKVLIAIHESNLSLLDYCFYNSTTFGFATYFGECIRRNNKKAIEIKNRKDKTYKVIIEIINKINNEELDYVGYYETTNLNPYLLINIARENDLYTDVLARFISVLRANNQLNIEKELNGVLVISEEEIPREIKEQAIEYLNSINAPMDTVVYNNMVRRLIKKGSK